MQCPHCAKHIHIEWRENALLFGDRALQHQISMMVSYTWAYRTAMCPACRREIIQIGQRNENNVSLSDWRTIYPVAGSRGPVSEDVPAAIAADYVEACNVLPISAKASAAMSRRCLQAMLHAHGYRAANLAREIDLLLGETDPLKALPLRIRAAVDAVRNFGNFSAHPLNDQTTLQVIDVEPAEAEWCLEITEDLFEHFYVGPAAARTKKAALDAKLAAAGKPPAK